MIERYRPQPSTLNIVTAMNHAGLFKPWFEGASWDGWRTVLKAAFGLPMNEAERAFFRTIAEREPPTKPVRELWCVVGRGGGKDSIASVIAAHAAALYKPDKLRPGERALVACLACDRDQAKIVLEYTRTFFQDILPLRGMVRRETATGFELSNKVDIAVATNSFRSVRGRSILCAIMDEVAFYRDDRSANPDELLYAALMPGPARVPNSILIGISTPHRRAGLLYNKFAKHYGQDSDVLVVRAPSITMNPTLDRTIISAALEEDPALASAEWLAEWRTDIENFVSRDAVEACVIIGRHELPPVSGTLYVGFVDPSGGSTDSMTLAIAHLEKGGRAILDAVRERRPPFSPAAVVEDFAAVLKSYRVSKVVGDHYGGEFVREPFRSHGLTYELASQPKSDFYRDMLPLLNSGKIELLDHPRLIAQLCGLERRVSRAGKDRIDHAPHGHDDVINAAAAALVLAGSARKPMVIPTDPAFWGRLRTPDRFGIPESNIDVIARIR